MDEYVFNFSIHIAKDCFTSSTRICCQTLARSWHGRRSERATVDGGADNESVTKIAKQLTQAAKS